MATWELRTLTEPLWRARGSLSRRYAASATLTVMELSTIIAAGGNGSGDLVVGLLVGCCIGILVGPAFRSWQIYREWVEASREVRLADRLLERMEIDADRNGHADPDRTDISAGSTWQPLP
jgi:hypothetical protein